MRSKKLQTIFSDFTDKVARVLEDEMKENMGLISAYVKYPHGVANRSKSISPSRKAAPMFYPEAPPPSNYQKSLYNKNKEHLRKLSEQNQ